MAAPRVLLVEDDRLLRRFVRMALDELPIELLECDSVAAAIALLNTAPVQLILTDLMLPGASGIDLLQHLQRYPALRGNAKAIVLSAGLTTAARQQLAQLDVWRMLDKPVPVQVLEQCVQEALAEAAAPASPGPGDNQASVIAQYFAGDAELFRMYHAASLLQLPQDIEAGNQASQAADLATLRRVAHSLKTVLLTLGAPALGAQARELEKACSGAQADAAALGWLALRAQLQAWIAAQQ